MLVGQRRRLLNYLEQERPRGLPRADPRARPAPLAPTWRIIAPGTKVPDFPLRREDGERLHAGRPAGQDDRLGLLPVRLQPGLHRPAQRLRGGRWTSCRAQGATLYGVSTATRRWSQKAFREKLGVSIQQLSDFEPKGAACARVRRVLRAGGHLQPRARDRRPRRRRGLVATRPTPRATCPASNLIFDALAEARTLAQRVRCRRSRRSRPLPWRTSASDASADGT